MTGKGDEYVEELEVARRISEVSRTHRGVDLGEPVLHDDGRRDSQYDIEFPYVTPPVALEVTSITDKNFVATAGASHKVADKITDAAHKAGAGAWVFVVSKDVALGGDTTAWMLDVVSGSVDDYETNSPPGVISVHHDPGAESGVSIATSSRVGPLDPVRPIEIEQLIERKSRVLRAAGDRERHLAIKLRDLRSKDLPPAPALPDEIDVLWLLWWERDLTFWLGRSDTDWQYNRDPWL